jgi:hypothetical protein
MIRAAASVAAVSALLLAFTAQAAAHGQLQVQVLTTSDLFVPPWAQGGAYGFSAVLERRLERRLAALRAAGSPTKVVLIAQRVDLQDVPYYFDRPRAYAVFLEQLLEAVRVYDGRLIVVMPTGTAEISGKQAAVDLRLRPRMTSEWDIDALGRVALRAVNGAARARVAATRDSRNGGRWMTWSIALAAAILIAFAVAVVGRRRAKGQARDVPASSR